MTVIIPHHKTQQEVVARLDKAVDDLFAHGIGGAVSIIDPRKDWTGSTMTFSLTGQMGFIKVPISGTAMVDDVNVTVICELPPVIKSFIGEAKVQSGIEKKMAQIVAG